MRGTTYEKLARDADWSVTRFGGELTQTIEINRERLAEAREQEQHKLRLKVAAEKERRHREEYLGHYQPCGECRNCERGGKCYEIIHRDDIGCSHDLGEGVTVSGNWIKCGGSSSSLPFVSVPAA